ncbi:MAG: AsmA-like C-terminal region-containing protein, partial [Burkholderiales bacterium]
EEAERHAREEAELRVQAERAARAEAEAKAESERRAREEAERLAREEAQTQTLAAREARQEAEAKFEAARLAREQAEARADAEKLARTEAEARIEVEKGAREESERRAKEEVERLAREEAERKLRDETERQAMQQRLDEERKEIEARIETERQAREQAEAKAAAERTAREEAEARARADMEAQLEAERRAREEAERRSQALAVDNSDAARKALEDAEHKAEQARKIREEAEERLEAEKRAREQMEARMAREATVRAKLIARMEDERRARAAAEDRAKMEAVARVMQQREFAEKSATEIQQRVDGELKARQQAELEADIRVRKEAQERAKAAAEVRARIAQEEAAAQALAQPRKPRKILLPVAIAALVLLGVAVALLQFMPLTPWVASAEKIAAERVGETVTIGKMHYSLFPSPGLTLENVVVGAQQDIRIPAVIVSMGIGQLISDSKRIDSVELQSPSLAQDALGRVLGWVRAPAAPARAAVERVSVRGARLTLRGMEPLSVNAELAFGADGALTKARLSLADGSLSADIVPQAEGASVSMRGSRFTPPLGPGYVFEDLELTATVTPTELRDIQAEGSVFGGKFKANGQARYAGPIAVDGRFYVDNLSLEPLVGLFANGVSVTGNGDLKGTFGLRAERLETLFDQARVEFTFSGNRGAIENVDLVRAAQAAGREGVRGGRTRYNTISGVVAVNANRASFQQFRIASDSMSAAGGFEIQPKGELAGRLGIQVGPRGTVVAQGNVAISGDVRNPVFR